MASVVTGILHFLQHYAFGINNTTCVDPDHNLLFISGWSYTTYKYNIDGTMSLVDTKTPGVWLGYGCTIDTERHFVFFGNALGQVYCYSYDNSGYLTFKSMANVWFSNGTFDLEIDTVNKVIVTSAGNVNIATLNYDDAGILILRADLRFTAILRQCGIDNYRNIAFTGDAFAKSYTYNAVGALVYKDTMPVATGTSIKTHSSSVRRFGFFGSAAGAYPFTYDTDGNNLTVGTFVVANAAFGIADYVALDRVNFLLFLVQTGAGVGGTSSFKYNSLTGELELISSEAGTCQGYRISVDNINHLVFTTGGTGAGGLDVFSYDVAPSISYKKLILDSGVAYKNYVSPSELGTRLGATRGGSTFSIEQEIKEMIVDGAHGPVKGSRRIISVRPKLTINFIEITQEILKRAFPGSDITNSPTTHKQFSRSLIIENEDYLTNVVIVAQMLDADNAEADFPIIVGVENALSEGNIELSFIDKDESGCTITFAGHFESDNLDFEPWFVHSPEMV